MGNAPKLRFEGFSDEWEQRKLGDCVIFLDTLRKPLKESDREKGIYPYYGASGIVDYVSDYIFDEELVLLSEDGANITDRNYPVCFLAAGKYWVNNHAHVMRVNRENENNFICNSLEKMDFTQYNSGMAMPKLNKDVCHNIPLFCPVYDEQKQIGDFFRSLDDLITLQQSKCAMLEKAKKYYLQNLFPQNGEKTPRLRFAGFTGEWEQRKLSEISDKVSKKNQDMVVDEVFTNSAEYGIILQRDYFDKDIANSENIDGYYIVEPNDFVYNPRISTLAPFGPIRRNKLKKAGAMSPLYYVFRTHDVDYSYLEYYFITSTWHSFMHLNGNSGARSDRFAIRDEIFKEMPILIPQDINEQKKIGSFFTNLDMAVALNQRKAESLKSVKQFMLQNMFV